MSIAYKVLMSMKKNKYKGFDIRVDEGVKEKDRNVIFTIKNIQII